MICLDFQCFLKLHDNCYSLCLTDLLIFYRILQVMAIGSLVIWRHYHNLCLAIFFHPAGLYGKSNFIICNIIHTIILLYASSFLVFCVLTLFQMSALFHTSARTPALHPALHLHLPLIHRHPSLPDLRYINKKRCREFERFPSLLLAIFHILVIAMFIPSFC